MNPHFKKVFDKLERQREQVFSLIRNVSDDVYRSSPNGKWSIAQIVTHMLTSERLSIGYMKKKSLGIENLKDSGIKQVIVSEILKISQRLPVRYKAPGVIVENTPEALSLEELVQQWDKARTDLRQFLESIPENYSRRLIFRHPILGMLNTEQSLKFMYEHINHHLPQIKRLIKARSVA